MKFKISNCENEFFAKIEIWDLTARFEKCKSRKWILTFWDLNSSGVLKSECAWIWFSLSLWKTECGSIGSMSVRSSWVLLMSSHVSNAWFRSGSEIETTCGWHGSWLMFGNMSCLFWWNVCFLWDQIENAFFKFHFY